MSLKVAIPSVSGKQQFLARAASTVLLKCLGLFFGFVSSVLLARMLGPNGYGTYAFALAIVTLLSALAKFGLPTLIVREVARGEGTGNPIGDFWGWAKRFSSVSVLLTLLLGLALLLGNMYIHKIEPMLFCLALLTLPFFIGAEIYASLLRGFRKIIRSQLPEMLVRPMIFIIFLLLGWLFMDIEQPEHVMTLYLLSVIAALITAKLLAMRYIPHAGEGASPQQSRAWAKETVPLAMLAGVQILNSQLDLVMLGFLSTEEETGVYRVITQLTLLVVFSLQAANAVAGPYFSRLYYREEMVELQNFATFVSRSVLAVAIPLMVLLVVCGEYILDFIYGDDYRFGYLPLCVLAVGQAINCMFGSVGVLLNMTGNQDASVRGMVIALALNAALNICLVPFYGALGAAIGTAASVLVWNILLWSAVKERLGINAAAFG